MNSATHSATTRPSNRHRAPASRLRMIANMPPIQETTGARKNEIASAGSSQGVSPCVLSHGKRETATAAGEDDGSTSVDPSLSADSTTSVRTESATMAERNVARATGRTKKAATASAITSQATSALRPYGANVGDGAAARYWMATRTTASTSVQPTSTGNPTTGGSDVARQMAARAANLSTDHTLTYPFPRRRRGVRPRVASRREPK